MTLPSMPPGGHAPFDRAAYLVKIRGIIAEHGWMVQYVGAGTTTPAFAYTVGLTAAGRPELVTVGLPPDVTGGLLNRAARLHLNQQVRPGDDVDVGYSVTFRAARVHNVVARRALGTARALYRDRVTAVQLLWPSAAGRWPDAADCDLPAGAQKIPFGRGR